MQFYAPHTKSTTTNNNNKQIPYKRSVFKHQTLTISHGFLNTNKNPKTGCKNSSYSNHAKIHLWFLFPDSQCKDIINHIPTPWRALTVNSSRELMSDRMSVTVPRVMMRAYAGITASRPSWKTNIKDKWKHVYLDPTVSLQTTACPVHQLTPNTYHLYHTDNC